MRKRLWSPDEDEKLQKYVSQHGFGNWSEVAKKTGLQRCGKSCRLRWINYLRPDLKRGKFSAEEKLIIVNLQKVFGNSWSKIAAHLPGRTDSDIKNFWHSHFRRKRPQQLITNAALHTMLPSSMHPHPHHPHHHHLHPPDPSTLLNSNITSSSSPFPPFLHPPSSSPAPPFLHHFHPAPDSISTNPNISMPRNPNISSLPPPHLAVPFSTTSNTNTNTTNNVPFILPHINHGLCAKPEINNYLQIINQRMSSTLPPAMMNAAEEAEDMNMYGGSKEEEEDQDTEGLITNDFELMGSLCNHAAKWYNGNKGRETRLGRESNGEGSNNNEGSMGASMSTKESGTVQMWMYESMASGSPHNNIVHAAPPPPPEGLDLVVWSCVHRPSQLDQEDLLPPSPGHISLANNLHTMSLNLHEQPNFLELESS